MENCATVSLWVELLATRMCVCTQPSPGTRHEHVRDLADFWAAAVQKSVGEYGSPGNDDIEAQGVDAKLIREQPPAEMNEVVTQNDDGKRTVSIDLSSIE